MKLIVLFVIGRLLLWAIQTNGLTKSLFEFHPKLIELRDCDFCLGFWVFMPLALALGINIIEPIYVPVLSEVVTGITISFAAHLGRLGWTYKFGAFELED